MGLHGRLLALPVFFLFLFFGQFLITIQKFHNPNLITSIEVVFKSNGQQMDRTGIFPLRKQRNKGLQNPALSLSVGFSTQNCSFSKGPQTHPSLVISTQNCSCSNALNFGFLEIFLDAPNKLQDIFCRNRNFYPLQHCLVPSKIPFFFLILQQRRAHVIRIHSLKKKKKKKKTCQRPWRMITSTAWCWSRAAKTKEICQKKPKKSEIVPTKLKK